MPLVKQELPTILEHLISTHVLAVFMILDLLFSVLCFLDHCLSLCTLVVVLSVLIRLTDYDYPVGIFKLFF